MRFPTVLALILPAVTAALSPVGAQETRPALPDLGGLKITGEISGEARRFRKGDRVPLEVVIHNPTKAAASFSYPGAWWYCGPSVAVTRVGKAVPVRHTELLGSVAVLRHTVSPGATLRIKHAGLRLGSLPDGKLPSEPSLEDPRPGKYVLRVQFEARAVGTLGGPRVELDPPVSFEVVD